MISVQEFITKIKQHPKNYFSYMLESLIDEQISYLYADLDSETLWGKNPTLLTEIEANLKKINIKNSWFTKIFTMFSPIKKEDEIYKKKLRILLDDLKVEIYNLKQKIQDNKDALHSISLTLNYLQKLKNELSPNRFFIKEIDDKIILLEGYNLTLSFKEVNLLELQKVYQLMNIKDYNGFI